MKGFHYRALSSQGETIQGFRNSTDALALSDELAAQNLILIHSKPVGRLDQALRGSSSVSNADLRDFTMHMATSLTAGIPVIQALRDIEEILEGHRFQEIVAELRKEISSGSHVTDALSHHPHAFPEIYVSLVQAGESSGTLDQAFVQIADYLEWSGDLKAKVQQALLYPALLASATVGLFLLMVLYVIPRFMQVFHDLDYELPTLTRRVLMVGEAFHYWWPFILGGILVGTILVKVAKSYERGRYELDRLLIGTPIIGRFIEKLSLSRFAKNFAMLLDAGIDILEVLALLKKVVGNSVLAREIELLRGRVMTGETLSSAIEQSRRFPPLIKRLIAVGETSGQLEMTLNKAAEHLDKELPRTLKKVFTVMEVSIIALLGLLIVTSALSMLLPIFQIQNQLLN